MNTIADALPIIHGDSLVCDIGATKIISGFTHNRSLPDIQRATPNERSKILHTVEDLLMLQISNFGGRVNSVVLGCPGLIDRSGHIHHALYVDLSNTRLREELADRISAPVFVINDAKLQAFGLLEQQRDFVYISIGSGVGGAIAVNGKIVIGGQGFAGELGHFPIHGITHECRCGRVGCFDTVAGGINLIETLGHKWWSNFTCELRRTALHKAGESCAKLIDVLFLILNSPLFVICGNIVRNPEFQDSINEWLQRNSGYYRFNLRFQPDSWPLALQGAAFLTTNHQLGDHLWHEQ
jgi:predicted NBD/HSP70 family sugar kinase